MDKQDQRFKLAFSGKSFVKEIARARTFCFMRDVGAWNVPVDAEIRNLPINIDTP